MADDDIKAMTPDGVTHIFPAGTPDNVIDNAIKTHLQLTTGQGMMTPKAPVPTPYGLQTSQQQAVTNAGQPQLAGAGLVPFNSATAGVGPQLDDEQRIDLAKSAMVQGASEVATSGLAGLAGVLGSTANASKLFNTVKGAVGTHAVNVTEDVGKAAFRIQQMADGGSPMPTVMRKFIARAAQSLDKPITYDEARQFYSNASQLTAEESMKLKPAMKWAVAQFADAWGDEIARTAGRAGQGENYLRAMQEYEAAKKAQAVTSAVKGAAVKTALGAAGVGGAAALSKKVYEATK